MMRALLVVLLGSFVMSACQENPGPAIGITGVQVFAALPGSNAGVAYMSIANNGNEAIVIDGVRSPQFAQIEIHESTVDEHGVSRMTRLDQVAIPAGETGEFRAGGKHLMLMGADPDTSAGSPVTLEISYGDALLLVSATLQNRLPAE